MALTLFRWIHVVAVSLWLGSLVFIIVVMRAPVQELGRNALLDPLLVKVRRRFKALLIATIAALAVSGIGALAVQDVPRKAVYIILVIVKILLSVGVIALFWYVAFVRQGPQGRPSPVGGPTSLDDESSETAGSVAPGGGAPGAAEAAAPTSEQIDDVDFLFRPHPRQAFVQWWIVGATAAAILLGLLVAAKGTGLVEQREQQRRDMPKAEAPDTE